MRVAEDMWRQGIGTRLTEVAIDWCRDHGVRTLVLNTTTPQRPAIGLYTKLGFREVGRTFIDRYELVWLRVEVCDAMEQASLACEGQLTSDSRGTGVGAQGFDAKLCTPLEIDVNRNPELALGCLRHQSPRHWQSDTDRC